MEWKTRVGVTIYLKGWLDIALQGIKLLILLRSFYYRVLERRVWLIVKLQIYEGQCGFCPNHGTLDQICSFAEFLQVNRSLTVQFVFCRLKESLRLCFLIHSVVVVVGHLSLFYGLSEPCITKAITESTFSCSWLSVYYKVHPYQKCTYEARHIVAHPTHPENRPFVLLPSGKRYRILKTKTETVSGLWTLPHNVHSPSGLNFEQVQKKTWDNFLLT